MNTWSLPGGHWVDHPYRLVDPERRGAVYVSEPYDLGVDDLRRLLQLAEQGWEVAIRAWGARHFPGHTLVVALTKGERAAPPL